MTMGRCTICDEVRYGRSLFVHNLLHDVILPEHHFFCARCIELCGFWCEAHDIAQIITLESRKGELELEQLFFGACYRCTWTALRTMDEGVKARLVSLFDDLPQGRKADRLLPKEGAGLLEPLSEQDKLIYHILFCAGLYGATPEQVVAQRLMHTKRPHARIN